MNNAKRCLMMFVLAIGAVFPQANIANPVAFGPVSTTDASCREALQNLNKIKLKMKDSEVTTLLGRPTAMLEDVWEYNFFECVKHPKVGTQTIFGLDLTFKDKVIVKIDYATICVTGTAR